MEIPEGMDPRRFEELGLSSNPQVPRGADTPLHIMSQTSTLQEEGMLTARELRDDVEQGKTKVNTQGSKPIRRRRGIARFTAIAKPARKSRRLLMKNLPEKEVEDQLIETSKPVKGRRAKPIIPPLAQLLQWDKDASGTGGASLSQNTI